MADGRIEGDDPNEQAEPDAVSESAPPPSPSTAPRLALDDDERLPWLESADDDDDYGAVDTGRVIGFVLAGLAALVLIVGGIWWATHRRGAEIAAADGSLIVPPAQPYKEAPKNAGGKTFAGTGDTSFAVSRGQTRPAHLAQATTAAPEPTASASPSNTPTATHSHAPKAKPAGAAPAAPVGVGVQVGAFSTQASAEAGWTRLSSQYPALKGLHHRVIEGKADIGTVYRLQALPGDADAANALCSNLRGAGLACQVKG
ncbi:MAG: SPOR domain-containing protein [Novosphingobium sp.]|nr:SPOR domain-containing protein [Novosphingobium sp.]